MREEFPCAAQGSESKGPFSFAKENGPFGTPRERLRLAVSGLNNSDVSEVKVPRARRCRISVAIRFAPAPIIRCRSAHLGEVRSNSRLPPVSTMRRAKQCRYFARSPPPSKRHSRLTIVRRGCKRSRLAGIHGEAMYTALTLRSACSSSSCKLPMCGVKGQGPLRSLGGSKGGHSLT